MRRIANECLRNMKSPIKFVMMHIHEALVNIAPERKEQFETDYPNFTLEYVDKYKFICNANPPNKYIKLSRRVVEILWVASYAYSVFYTKVIQVVKLTKKQHIDLTQNKEIADSMKLLKWGFENWLNKGDNLWPSDLPKPVENPQKGTMEDVAKEFCLCAVSFILHHELAHIRLKHDADTIDLEKEREADYAAADWILKNEIPVDDYRFIKRVLGIAIALEVLTAYGIYTGEYGGKAHPLSYDRLVNAIHRYVDDKNHLVWSLLASTLKLHLDSKQIDTPDTVFATFYDCVNTYADVLSRRLNTTNAS